MRSSRETTLFFGIRLRVIEWHNDIVPYQPIPKVNSQPIIFQVAFGKRVREVDVDANQAQA